MPVVASPSAASSGPASITRWPSARSSAARQSTASYTVGSMPRRRSMGATWPPWLARSTTRAPGRSRPAVSSSSSSASTWAAIVADVVHVAAPTRSSSGGESPRSWNSPHAGQRPMTSGHSASGGVTGVSGNESARGWRPRSSDDVGIGGVAGTAGAGGHGLIHSSSSGRVVPGGTGRAFISSPPVARVHRRCTDAPRIPTGRAGRGRCGAIRWGPGGRAVTFRGCVRAI